MVITCAQYDRVRDIQETVPNLANSIKDMIESHVVPSGCVPAEYNHLEEFSNFGGLVRDGFDAVDYRDAQGRFASAVYESRVKSTQKGEGA